ncbi:PREDICTED: protein FAM110C [Chinchilla lanigera]|uniref:protein FAM110C n=1 Tax=Chinchilla lanigera TaxID=34839 RepID=UPI00038F03CE|nr:PREDICTED: protein FAM110C [Chinchilla lanigera]
MRALPALSAPRDPARPSAVERLAADRARFSRGPVGGGVPTSKDCGSGDNRNLASEPRSPGAPGGGQQPSAPGPALQVPAPVSRRVIPRRPLRPDSLVIYRQKCDFVRSPGSEGSRGSLVKKLFPGPGRDRTPETPGTPRLERAARTKTDSATPEIPRSSGTAAIPATPGNSRTPGTPAAPAQPAPPGSFAPPGNRARTSSPRAARRAGLQRSHSDLSRCSCDPGAERDAFFQFCGLDPEVVEALGRDNFSAGSDCTALKVRSVSVATSEGGFSRHSGGEDDGLQEEALTEQVPSTTSIIERNARIIKWLYTCRKAKGTPGQGLQGPA